ncbi:unnamed protein product [Vitrella brassicaformis CCMP3155]|uniref:Selenoprotein W-related protein n=1 Tax=Vitrella brassicaformis (strain CCMP3155) TaxID=1169540 RepID=A0A0G4EB89_VITBC|nr:unnamed protein product [Vitrella brassicaformis CCMP3155]|eukprot:CEL92764.1 unnamed protein product [Vitrella brassicaformis CCMP3155]
MPEPRIEIEYCVGCRWMLRAAWMAQELLSTFAKDIGEVALIPNNDPPGGVFVIRCNGVIVFSREKGGHFIEAKELKTLIRDVICPDRPLGHSEHHHHHHHSQRDQSGQRNGAEDRCGPCEAKGPD